MSELFQKQTEDDIKEEENEIVTDRYLTFTSDSINFAINTLNVIEILSTFTVRAVPMVPEYVIGVLNLRGQVLPIVDMRLRMSKPFSEYTDTTCVIVIEYEQTMIGLVVDSVLQVQTINQRQASPIPVDNKQDIANSMIKLDDDSVVLLIDCKALLSDV